VFWWLLTSIEWYKAINHYVSLVARIYYIITTHMCKSNLLLIR